MNYECISILLFGVLAVIRIKIMFYLLSMGQKALEQDPTSVQHKDNGRGMIFYMLHIGSKGALIAQMSEEK